jgi:hypothetical protein
MVLRAFSRTRGNEPQILNVEMTRAQWDKRLPKKSRSTGKTRYVLKKWFELRRKGGRDCTLYKLARKRKNKFGDHVTSDTAVIFHRHRDNIYADRACTILLEQALEDTSHGKWWRSDGGAFERPATRYEIIRAEEGDAPPREGWTLVDSAREQQAPFVAPSELREEEKAAKAAKRAAKIVHYQKMLKRAETRAKRAQTQVKTWKKRISALTRKDRTP